MHEKTVFFSIIGTNVLLYILAFALAVAKKQNMNFYIALLVIELVMSLICIFLYFFDESPRNSLGWGYVLAWIAITLIAFSLVLAVAIFVNMPSWKTAAYILLSVSILWAMSFAIDAIPKEYAARQSAKRTENYYKNNYITVYELEANEKKYLLMLEKSALETNTFDSWSFYSEDGHYIPSKDYENVKGILRHAKYKVLNEEIHSKIQEKMEREEEIDDLKETKE